MKPLGPPSRIAVGSGGGGLPFAERGSSSSARRRSSIVWRNWRSGLKVGCAWGPIFCSSPISSLARPERARADLRRLAERIDRGGGRLRERPEAGEELVEAGRGALQVREQRRLLVGQLAEAGHGRAQLVEEGRQLLEGAPQLGPPGGRDLRRVAGLLDPAHHVALVRLELLDDAVRVGDEVLDDLVLVAQDPQHPRGLAQAGVGAAERLREVLRPAREPGAQRRDDQAEALAVRAAHDVVDQVGGDRGGGLLHRHGAALGQLLGRAAGLAVHEVLADQRLRLDVAGRVRAEVVEAALGHLDGHDRLRRLALALHDAEVAGSCRRSRRPPGSRRPPRARRRCRRRPGSACRPPSRSRRPPAARPRRTRRA